MELGGKRLQQFVGRAVPMLLAANAVAVVGLLATNDPLGNAGDPAVEAPAADGTSGAPRTVTLITRRDGTTVRVDPTSTDGKRAIDAARKEGLTVVTVPVGSTTTTSTTTTTTTTAPKAQSGGGLPLDPKLITDTAADLGKQVGDTTTKLGEDAANLIDKGGADTGTSPATAPVSGIVRDVTSTVGNTVGGAVPTVTPSVTPSAPITSVTLSAPTSATSTIATPAPLLQTTLTTLTNLLGR